MSATEDAMVRVELGPVRNVFYFVDDLEAATKWYVDRLGKTPVVTGRSLAAFDVSGTRLTVHQADEFNTPGPAGTSPYWEVHDVDAIVASWTEHGAVAHRGPKTVFTGERLCQMLDPFGNLFSFVQPAPVTSASSAES